MERVYNFGAGPAMLPEPVLQQAKAELLNWQGIGSSVMEISHRGADFRALADEVERDFRELLHVPEHYKVLFMPGGGQGQFSLVPMNLLNGCEQASYVNFGQWTRIAIDVAKRYCKVNVVADTSEQGYKSIIPQADWQSHQQSAYLYVCDNETIEGVEFPFVPAIDHIPLISDMSSNLLSRRFDINQYGMVFACAQKNLGPAGITIVVIREDLLERSPLPHTPPVFCYHNVAAKNSMFHTPPTFPWYMMGLVLKWIKSEGGLLEMEQRNLRKSQKLYNYIDQSGFYYNDIEPQSRSRMNVIFRLQQQTLQEDFLSLSTQAGLRYLKGHRLVGGLRASIYNAMPEAGIDALIEFMQDFAKQYG